VRHNPSICTALALDGDSGEFVVKATRGSEAAEERAQVVKTRCGYEVAQVTLWLKPLASSGK
jgi:hypothetical protein